MHIYLCVCTCLGTSNCHIFLWFTDLHFVLYMGGFGGHDIFSLCQSAKLFLQFNETCILTTSNSGTIRVLNFRVFCLSNYLTLPCTCHKSTWGLTCLKFILYLSCIFASSPFFPYLVEQIVLVNNCPSLKAAVYPLSYPVIYSSLVSVSKYCWLFLHSLLLCHLTHSRAFGFEYSSSSFSLSL